MQPLILSAHIGYLFGELPLTDRIAAARAAGFDAVEHPTPFSIPASDLKRRLDAEGLVFTQLASPIGDPGKGEKGLAALAGREAEFRDGFARALDYAETIDCPYVHPMAGSTTDPDAPKILQENLAFAVAACRGRKPRVLIEAISPLVVPNYVLAHPDQSVRLAEQLGPEVRVLLDMFHATASGVNPADFLSRHARHIGHIHAADHPGRHEPGTGNLDFPALLDTIAEVRFRGAIGFEYVPSAQTTASLEWMPAWRAHRPRPINQERPQ